MRKIPFLLTLALTAGVMTFAANSFAGEGAAKCVNCIPKTQSRPCKTKVCTEVVDRCSKTCTAKGPCGKTYCYTVTVITYKDTYCDGSTRIWTSSI